MFLIGFGLPNLRKYLKDESVEVMSKEILKSSTQAPAITICPINPNSGVGLKTNQTKQPNDTFFKMMCGQWETAQDIEKCVIEQTYKISEAVPNISHAGSFLHFKPSKNSEQFTTDITCIGCGWGQCYTLEKNATILTFGKLEFGPLTFALNKSLNFDIFFHDKRFFYISMNPGMTPGFRLSFRQKDNLTRIVSLKAIKQVKRNTFSNPCHEDTEYSFTDCIREKIEDEVGCLLPWKRATKNKKLELCKTIERFVKFEKKFYEINDKTPTDITNEYGCQIPCEYTEYVLVEDLPVADDLKNILKLNFNLKILHVVLSSREVLVKREVQLYGLTSLVGDTGGSLGLFLGFSFVTLWDWAVAVTEAVRSKLRLK